MGVQYSIAQDRRIKSCVQDFEAHGRNRGVARGGRMRQAIACLARITAVSGSFPQWSYTTQYVTGYDSSQTGAAKWVTDGVDLTGCLNTLETTGTAPYTYGNGITITSSSGQCNSTACVIQPIGVGAVVELTVSRDQNGGAAIRSFRAENSGQ